MPGRLPRSKSPSLSSGPMNPWLNFPSRLPMSFSIHHVANPQCPSVAPVAKTEKIALILCATAGAVAPLVFRELHSAVNHVAVDDEPECENGSV